MTPPPWVAWVQRLDRHRMGILLSLLLITRGLWLLAPWWDTFRASPVNNFYVQQVAPEEWWGAWALLIGVGQLIATVQEGRAARAVTALFAASYWSSTALLVWLASGWAAVGPIHFSLFAFTCLWVFWRTIWRIDDD